MKYHKNIYFPLEHKEKLEDFNQKINLKKIKFSNHAKLQFYNRVNNIKYFHDFLTNIEFKITDIFEYKIENNIILNAVYRIKYNNIKDIIISLANNKSIITFYFNNIGDNHYTLNKLEYINQ